MKTPGTAFAIRWSVSFIDIEHTIYAGAQTPQPVWWYLFVGHHVGWLMDMEVKISFYLHKEAVHMQKWIYSLLIVSLALITFGCKSHEVNLQEQGVQKLSQSELESMFATPVSIKYDSQQSSGSQEFKPDGTTSVEFGRGSDTGTYRFVNGQYCSTWDNIRVGEACWNVYKISDKELHFVKTSGALHAKVYIQ